MVLQCQEHLYLIRGKDSNMATTIEANEIYASFDIAIKEDVTDIIKKLLLL